MDRDGKVADLYGVTGIPQTVVIDKSGKIYNIHVGYRPDIELLLKVELRKLTSVPTAQTP